MHSFCHGFYLFFPCVSRASLASPWLSASRVKSLRDRSALAAVLEFPWPLLASSGLVLPFSSLPPSWSSYSACSSACLSSCPFLAHCSDGYHLRFLIILSAVLSINHWTLILHLSPPSEIRDRPFQVCGTGLLWLSYSPHWKLMDLIRPTVQRNSFFF